MHLRTDRKNIKEIYLKVFQFVAEGGIGSFGSKSLSFGLRRLAEASKGPMQSLREEIRA